jgi:hypothetical protein
VSLVHGTQNQPPLLLGCIYLIMAAVPPPNIANAAANLTVNTGAPIVLADPLVRQAARAAKRRRIMETLVDGMVTEDENGHAVVYEHQTAVAAAAAAVAPPLGAVAVPPGAPAWAGPLFGALNTLNNLNNTVNNMNNALNNLTNTVNNMNSTLSNVEARSINNAVSMDQNDLLFALRNAARPSPQRSGHSMP